MVILIWDFDFIIEKQGISSNFTHFFGVNSNGDSLKGEAANVVTTFDDCNELKPHNLSKR